MVCRKLQWKHQKKLLNDIVFNDLNDFREKAEE
jgi:hypothetical protein